ncbi:MBL fold metallo-hydrolase [Cupriavidus gilardii]|uniref:MBL fold metallo-hydrolase n=1 Tax=Cupriavidus gilardii TaxID=82541 RepID=UPI001ABDC846|nr:MBL fold metallo-hydrolase [Cupriavidus gilardii]MBO4122561.1 MBL fold metallo-hydrolase [Cupriavidus gilardii]
MRSRAEFAANEVLILEAMNARHGDALLLHYGTRARPKSILIDGGALGVYKATVRPRLAQLARERGVWPLPIEHAFVTHLDSDHIRGVLDMIEDRNDPPAACWSYWFNSFEDTKAGALPMQTAVLWAQRMPVRSAALAAVEASVAEGQSLRDAVRARRFVVNGGAGSVLVADGKGVVLDVDPNLNVVLIAPDAAHLRRLADDWARKAAPTTAETVAYLDSSVFNLSSLVMVIEAKAPWGRTARLLLTGDARGDHTLAGLHNAGYLDEKGQVHFDLLKVAHHGSDRNHEPVFFSRVTADHYVISADGRYGNPSAAVLAWIGETGRGDYRVWLTNQSNTGFAALEANIAEAIRMVPALEGHLRYREAGALSLCVDLLEAQAR